MMQKFRISSGGVNVRCARDARLPEVTGVFLGRTSGRPIVPRSHPVKHP